MNALPGTARRQYGVLKMQALLLVYNDAVPALVSGTDGQLEGCVLIAGTGLLPPPSCHNRLRNVWT